MPTVHYAAHERNRASARQTLARLALTEIAARAAACPEGTNPWPIAEAVFAWELDAVTALFDHLRACFASDDSAGEQPPTLAQALAEATAHFT